MNSACNPIIYAWRSPSFREGYKEILCQEPSYVVSDGMYTLLLSLVIHSYEHNIKIHLITRSNTDYFYLFIHLKFAHFTVLFVILRTIQWKIIHIIMYLAHC